MKLIAFKTSDGALKGNISFCCKMLHVTRQGFYQYLTSKDRPWKYQELADAMMQIHAEDECNDTYGRIRMYQALKIKQPEGVRIPSERTVYRVMEEIGLSHRPNHRPNGITKTDHKGMSSKVCKFLIERNIFGSSVRAAHQYRVDSSQSPSSEWSVPSISCTAP